jgi:hypothetical protein
MIKINKKILAPIAYLFAFILIYSVVLENISWVDKQFIPFEPKKIFFQNEIYTWGNHNLTFALTILIASFLSGIISGAMVKKRNSYIAPLCFLIVITFFISTENNFVFDNVFTIIFSSIASIYLSFLGSNIGVEIEKEFVNKDNNTVLGINTFHWIWILFPLSVMPMYLWGVAFVHALLRFFSLWWTSEDFSIRIASLICIIPIILWALIPFTVYRILSGIDFDDKNNFYKSGLIVSIFLLGSCFALAIQMFIYFIIQQFLL